MYAGRKVEDASVEEIFDNPRHPYTRGLLGAIPKLGASADESAPPQRLTEIPGAVPSLIAPLKGCSFAGRCPVVRDVCQSVAPALREVAAGHQSACHFAEELGLTS
jgi:peptide/nickel transport system ATP-binding protein